MIKSVYIHNFKAFTDVEQAIAPLTILTGLNGRGKSSFIQAILLAWATLMQDELYFSFNNEYVSLKSAGDVFSWYHQDDILKLGLCFEKSSVIFESVPILSNVTSVDSVDLTHSFNKSSHEAIQGIKLRYLSTWRMGDLRRFPIAPPSKIDKGLLSERSGDGVLTPRYLELRRNDELPIPALALSDESRPLLLREVDNWLKVISPDLRIKIDQGQNEMRLAYYPAEIVGIPTIFAEAINVGFGISYALPVITAILVSQPGDIVIIETPEAHVHPAGQARLMDLFARAAAAGVQVILETHSDHIIHGLLRNLKAGVISEETACVLYFDKNEQEDGIAISSLQCTSKGRIKGRPKGFFDQYMIDMKELL